MIQLYARPAGPDGSSPDGSSVPDDERPERWLAGFASVTAGPGESATATIQLPDRAFQIWADGWQTVTGEYMIEAAHSIADIRLTTVLTVS